MNQISPMAFVHPEAKLGDNNIIGPFCYIDRNTVMGDSLLFQTLEKGGRSLWQITANITTSRQP